MSSYQFQCDDNFGWTVFGVALVAGVVGCVALYHVYQHNLETQIATQIANGKDPIEVGCAFGNIASSTCSA